MIRRARHASPWFKATTSVRKSRLLAVLPAVPPAPPSSPPHPPTVDMIMDLVCIYGGYCIAYGKSPTPESLTLLEDQQELIYHHVSLLDGYLTGTKYLLTGLQQTLTTPPEEHP